MSVQKLNDTMTAAQNYDGKRFKGTVVASNDPTGQGRVKVHVPGLYEQGELPWVGTVKASPFGYGPGYGVYGDPTVGSVIEIQLQEGSANHPISEGFLADTSTTRDPEFDVPGAWGYKDPSGNKLVVDQTNGSYKFTHSSGTTYSLDSEGNLTVEGLGTATMKFPKIVLDGDVDITGQLSVQKIAEFLAGFIARARAGGGASIMQGDVNHENGTFRSNGVTIHLHIHQGEHGPTSPPEPNT